jgi:dTDP-4-dehydrorhamnose 3,5-epimerase-like enzyme
MTFNKELTVKCSNGDIRIFTVLEKHAHGYIVREKKEKILILFEDYDRMELLSEGKSGILLD